MELDATARSGRVRRGRRHRNISIPYKGPMSFIELVEDWAARIPKIPHPAPKTEKSPLTQSSNQSAQAKSVLMNTSSIVKMDEFKPPAPSLTSRDLTADQRDMI